MVILGTYCCGRHDGMGDTMMPVSMVVLRAVWCSLPLWVPQQRLSLLMSIRRDRQPPWAGTGKQTFLELQ